VEHGKKRFQKALNIGRLFLMARCEICDKAMLTGHRISITRSQVSRRANRKWKANIKKLQIVEANGNVRTIHICTRCLRSNKVKRAI
jgi:large subunit ribosomal protein L28